MSSRALLATLITILPWSSVYPIIKNALQDFSPVHLVLLRFLVASAALLVYALATRMPLPTPQDWWPMLGLSLLGISIYHTSLSTGLQSVASGPAAILIACGPVFVALMSYFFMGERLSALGWLGIAIAFFGVALIAVGNHPGRFRFEPGALLILLAALATSVYFVFQRSLVRKYSALQFTVYSIWAGTLPLLVFLPGLSGELTKASAASVWSAVYLGIFPSAVAYMTWNYALSIAPASRVTSFLYVSPILAYLLAYLLRGEVPTALALVGGAVALVGVVVLNVLGKVKAAQPQKPGAEGVNR